MPPDATAAGRSAGKTRTAEPHSVRVLPDVPAIDREFDYAVPEHWHDDGRAGRLAVGSIVRVPLQGRRVRGWVVELDPVTPSALTLQPLAKLSSVGPSAETIDLCRWVAHRWVGRTATVLRSASPPRAVSDLPSPTRPSGAPVAGPPGVDAAFEIGRAVVRLPPPADPFEHVLAAARLGHALVITPAQRTAAHLLLRLRRAGIPAAGHPKDWPRAAAGATVVGTRAAALAPMNDLGAVLVIDEHDEALQQEQTPLWHAREVAAERARRAGVPAVLLSATPSLEALEWGRLLAPSRSEERAGWPALEIVDQRDLPPGQALLSPPLVRLIERGGRVGCIVNRKGRSRLLVCSSCDELAACDRCGAALGQDDRGELSCRSCGHTRPIVCSFCGGTSFKNRRLGVSRAREEMEALIREPVAELTGGGWVGSRDSRVVLGTEALLHQMERLDTVAFLDFDQELLAPRFRAHEQALGLLSRAARLVGGRRDGSRVMVQTRCPGHEVVRAALRGDPAALAAVDRRRRVELRLPPFGALAEISGAGAGEFVARLGSPIGLQIAGPTDGPYLVRCDDRGRLADELGRVERPPGRLRIAVDPPRV